MFDHTDILILSLILVVAAPLQKCKDFLQGPCMRFKMEHMSFANVYISLSVYLSTGRVISIYLCVYLYRQGCVYLSLSMS